MNEQRQHVTASQFTDRILYCVECHEPFVFTRGEQLFFRHQGFMNDPRRCKECRIKAQARREKLKR